MVDYSAPTSTPISGTLNDIPNFMLEFRALGGYDFPILTATILTPYIGFGYRYLNDDSGGMTTSAGFRGYEREANYFYSPVGIEVITSLEDGWSIGATAEYDFFWWGRQISHLSGIDSTIGDMENDQKKGYGIRGSVKVQKQIKDRTLIIVIEPYIRYWNIEDSETSFFRAGSVWDLGWEAANNSMEIGSKIAMKF